MSAGDLEHAAVCAAPRESPRLTFKAPPSAVHSAGGTATKYRVTGIVEQPSEVIHQNRPSLVAVTSTLEVEAAVMPCTAPPSRPGSIKR